MEKRHQTLLERNYSALLNAMEVDKVLDCMRESSLFGLDSEDVDRAAHGPTRRERARLVIQALMRKGPQAFAFFVRALYVTSADKVLAEKLAKEGGISIAELRPPPQPQYDHQAAVYQTPRTLQPAQPTVVSHSQGYSGLPPLPFNSVVLEDDPQLYHRRDIYEPHGAANACQYEEERATSHDVVVHEDRIPVDRAPGRGERATVRAMPVSEESHQRSNRGELVFGARSFAFPPDRSMNAGTS